VIGAVNGACGSNGGPAKSREGVVDAGDPGADATDVAPDDSVLADCAVGPAGEPTELRCTGIYADWDTKTLASGVRPYDPGLRLWSDGAVKTRWIYLPPGTQIDTSDMDEWTFPAGTKLWKEFVVGGVRLETRMVWKRPADSNGGWYLTTYRWSADQSRADELTAGEINADGNGYEIPNQNACVQCHQGRLDVVMGFEVVSLSSPAASGLTMARLQSENLLTAPPTAPLAIPGDAPTVAALGYLHANCGIACHNRGNGQTDSALLMRLDVATLDSVQHTDAWVTGMNVPAYFLLAGTTQQKVFAPCSPSTSAAYYRMSVRDGINGIPTGNQMPPIGSHQPDPTGLAILAAWLNDQPPCGQTGP
jgi:hypothetical protein